MSMDNLERRALLGNRQAQEECTAKGILLPCPFCGCRMRLLEGDSYFGTYLVKCVWCGAGTREAGNKYVAIYLANRRPAPPIGRCKDCAHSSPHMVMGNKTYGKVCKIDPYLVHEVNPDGYCDGFKPKEATND